MNFPKSIKNFFFGIAMSIGGAITAPVLAAQEMDVKRESNMKKVQSMTNEINDKMKKVQTMRIETLVKKG